MSEASRAQGVHKEPIEKLHDEFRHLLTLLILACAYNSGGVPILSDKTHGIPQPSQEDEIAFRKLTSRGILSAIATILVREHEVFAVTDVTPTDIISVMKPSKADDLKTSDGNTIPGPWFASLKNPRNDGKSKSTTNFSVPFCELVQEGKPVVDLGSCGTGSEDDYWNHLLGEKFNAGDIVDHIATVIDFMTKHVHTNGDDKLKDRIVLGDRFTQYIVVVCSVKMQEHVSHWATIGMLHNLCSLAQKRAVVFSKFDEDFMKDARERHKRNDRTLIGRLITLRKHFPLFYEQHPESQMRKISFENLVRTADSNCQSLYNKDTCAEFHDLLISVLFAYANHLHGFSKSKKAPQADKLLHSKGIFFFLHMLWDIQESQAYRLHFEYISAHLEPINFSSINVYKQFTEAVELHIRMPSGAPQAMAIEAADNYNDADDGDDGDDGDGTPLDNALHFRTIISKLVAYVGAIRMLQKYCATIGRVGTQTFRASLISAKHPREMKISWAGIRTALSKIKLEGIPMDDMEKTLSAMAKSGMSPHFSLGLFKDLINKPNHNYPGCSVHCEALLGALMSYGARDWCSEDLFGVKRPIQVPERSELKMIAVSKLCCPVCWELLLILEGKPTVTRGRHSTLYFQHLPNWLPRQVLDKMLEQFRKYAAVELRKAYMKHNKPIKTHVQNPSQETTYAVSIASENLDEDIPEQKVDSYNFPPGNQEQAMKDKEVKGKNILRFFSQLMTTNPIKRTALYG